MALECDWALFCERAYFDLKGPPNAPNHLCIINVIEYIKANVAPSKTKDFMTGTRATPFMLVAHLVGSGRTDQIGLRVWSPSGGGGVAPWYKAEGFEHADPYLLFRLGGFDFLEEGPYRFEVLFGDQVARTAVLEVKAPPAHGAAAH